MEQDDMFADGAASRGIPDARGGLGGEPAEAHQPEAQPLPPSLNAAAAADAPERARQESAAQPASVRATEETYAEPAVEDVAAIGMLAGDPSPIATPVYRCPSGDGYEWMSPGQGAVVPKCPFNGVALRLEGYR
jgi:hypothetical protein